MNEFTGDREWSIDITPDKESRALIKRLGISDRMREPKDTDSRTESFMSFRHKELRNDGTRADPLRIVDADANPWDNRLIGNGTEVNAKFVVKDYGKGRKKGVYLRAIQVINLVPYVIQDFAPIDTDEEHFAGGAEAKPQSKVTRLPEGLEPVSDDLDDDIPV